MALIVNDRVRESTTVVGTGTATLLGAITGYQAFSVIGNGNTCYYTISDQIGANWEVGIGTYTLSGTTLARTTVLKSSNANALVSFTAGTKDVFVTYPAETSVSGGGGGTYPTIQPSLNLDFANTKLLDPRITFVRNSTAAYYDGQTTAMAEQNLLLQSNTFSNAAWVATNGTVASGVTDPAGTTTAFSFTATGVATLYQTLTTTATPYTLSFYIQRVTGTGAVNLTLDGTTLTAQTITGSWARYSVTATPTAASHTIGIQLAVITDSVNIFSSQLENRSSMTAANITTTAAITNYIPVLMTAPAGVARFDCDPITRNSLGLLIEESRVNLVTYSSDFSNAAWTKSGVTITADTMIAPDGTLSMDAMVSSVAGVTSHFVSQYAVFTGAGTVTVYVKVGAVDWFYILSLGRIPTDAPGGTAWFNLRTGVVGAVDAGYTSSMVHVGNGIYRCTLVCATSASAQREVRFGSTFANSNQAFDCPAGTIMTYIWGAQLEAGAFATSYIPTVASTVTRAADAASMTGTNFSSWYNQSEGSLYAEADTITTFPYPYSMILEGGPSSSFYSLGVGGNSTTADIVARSFIGGSNESIPCTWGSNILNKLSSSYNNKSLALSAINGSIKTLNSYSSLNVPTYIFIGSRGSSGTLYLNGHIKKLSYYPVALSSSNLVALTS